MDIATTLADQLEKLADRARSMTVDRARSVITKTSIGIAAGVLALYAAIVLIKGLFRLLAIVTTEAGAYGIFGGIFVIAGGFVWAKRNTTSTS